ncbi:hypothetical protein IQ255_29685, partial [Pleurocapsales cyanobacterium LEGE 10410]|nr:hypothetical protein [Pleurocapsales cyanobacterium LEGE 10410]
GYHTGTLSTAEYQLAGHFAVRFSESVWAGVRIKYNHAVYHPDIPASKGLGLDAGVLIRLTETLQVAAAIQDFLATIEIDGSDLYGTDQARDRDQAFPLRTVIGLSWEVTDRWLISQDAEVRFQQFERTQTETEERNGFPVQVLRRADGSSRHLFIRTGTRYLLHERLTLRGGVEVSGSAGETRWLPSAGFSVHLPFDSFSPSVDYAVKREPARISSMHVFAIRLNI